MHAVGCGIARRLFRRFCRDFCALLSAPRLLLLDEPLTALDVRLKETVLQQLRSLHHEFGVPMLYVTHDPLEAIAICGEVLMLESGKIISRGDPRELLV